MIDRNHPAVEALEREGYDHTGGTMHAWRCEYPDRYPGYCTCPEDTVALVRDSLTPDDLRHTHAGQVLMAEAWGKFQEHYADQWDEWYPEDIFPSPAPPPAVVSRESVAAFMMRHWAERLRADPNPYKETQ